MSDPIKPGVEIHRPAYLLDVKLNRGQRRDIDLRLVAKVERSFQARETWVFWTCGADPLQIHYSEFDRVHRAWRVHQERSAQNDPTKFSGANLDESDRPFVEFGKTEVCSWTPERDGRGTPEQVHLLFDVTIAGMPMRLVQRFKGKGALNALIDALTKHREEVWPTL